MMPLLDDEGIGEARDLEHTYDAVRGGAEHERAPLRLEPLLGLHEQADPGRVDELDAREVEHERVGIRLREIRECSTERTGRAELELTADDDDRFPVAALDRQRQLHLIVGAHARGA